jgi:hypothetical protein
VWSVVSDGVIREAEPLEELEQLKNLVPARPRRRPPAVDEQRVLAAVSTRLQLSIDDRVTVNRDRATCYPLPKVRRVPGTENSSRGSRN